MFVGEGRRHGGFVNRQAATELVDAKEVQSSPSLPGPAETVTVGDMKPLAGIFRTPTMEKLERLIRQQLESMKDDERLDRIVVALAESNIMVAFERTCRNIFGSQIEALKRLNVAAQIEKDLRPIYEAAVARAPDFYPDYPFESWMRYLQTNDLASEDRGVFAVTDAGRDFLRYLVNMGYSEVKPG